MDRARYNEGKAYIKKEFEHHLSFLDTLALFYETDTHIFVHAGLIRVLKTGSCVPTA